MLTYKSEIKGFLLNVRDSSILINIIALMYRHFIIVATLCTVVLPHDDEGIDTTKLSGQILLPTL
jgi:hypothetical protein